MKNNESAEMYLENILVLKNRQSAVRAVDVAHFMNYSKPSVSRAMSLLKKDGSILVDNDGNITLTERGYDIAAKIYERHNVITKCLVLLGVDEEIASADACRIEHVISDETFAMLKNHMDKMSK